MTRFDFLFTYDFLSTASQLTSGITSRAQVYKLKLKTTDDSAVTWKESLVATAQTFTT